MDRMGFFAGIARVLGGKGELRLIIQPLVAIVLGIRLGLADAREHRAPYGVRVLHSRHHLRFALSDIVVPFCIAIVIDAILQHYTLGYVRPLAAVLVAALLVWLPYSLARGFTNRIASGRTARSSP